ncbi:MAG: M43 family zinc metalloprotease [Brumimicrobium sp.]|nr:M43 family zinc metalloprotease [Brumimicrobium sp.]
MLRSLLVIVLFFYSLNGINAQEHLFPCSTDEMHHRLFTNHPEFNAGIIAANEELEAFTAAYISQANNHKNGNPYIIPVVFHIIHDYGMGNIDDAQILDAVNQVNLQLRKLNGDTSDIVNDFIPLAADTEIEIRLAQLDPNGNCTNGITRTVSELTNIGDHQVKSLIQWPPDKYLNIYVCNQAAGLAGHALLPAAADTIPQWDGIVMQHSYVGTIGTSDYFRRTVLTHEIGHYLNLQHIWGGNNVPGYYYLPVAHPDNCNEDDGVNDTPETIGWQSCNLSGTSCGTLDNVQNYMDYAYCARMFTEGQKLRMHAALNSNVANRNNLWSTNNLIATGTSGDTNYLCQAKLSADKKTICVGETITFSDISYHGVNQRNWTFQGGNIAVSSDSVVQVSFNTPGIYDVSLEVGNGTNSVSVTYLDFIRVMESPGTSNGLIESFEFHSLTESRWMTENEENPFTWDFAGSGFNSDSSFFVNNFDGPADVEHAFHSTPFNASGMTELTIHFDYAFARRTSDNNDILRIQVSNNCGDTWSTRKTISTSNLISVQDTVITPFFPGSQADWKQEVVSLSTASFLVDDLLIRFLFESDGGNNLFVDNILIADSQSLYLNEEYVVDEVKIYPNPSSGTVEIYFPENFKMQNIQIYDSYGKRVMNEAFSISLPSVKLPLKGLGAGQYFVHISDESGLHRTIKKLIILP